MRLSSREVNPMDEKCEQCIEYEKQIKELKGRLEDIRIAYSGHEDSMKKLEDAVYA